MSSRRRWGLVGLGAALAASLLLALAIGAGRLGPRTAAQAASPPPGNVPPASACTVAPRQIPPPPATPIVASPVATAAYVPPTGQPAGPATTQAVTATIRESVACANAGEALRSLALYSDRYVENYLYGPTALDISILRQTAATPQPAASGEQLALVSISDITAVPDGRVAAKVVTRNPTAIFTDELILVNQHGRWLIDEFHQLATQQLAATAPPPVPATAAAGGAATVPPVPATATAGG